jgi:predicted nucleic acid-binding protein
MKVFIDTDVILDLLAKREPFFNDAARLFTLADKQELHVHVSSLCFSNLSYILGKQHSLVEVRKILARLKVIVSVLSVDDRVIELALNSDFKDFEDAIQYYCAIENGVKVLVTRNLKDFKLANIPVVSPKEFLNGQTEN